MNKQLLFGLFLSAGAGLLPHGSMAQTEEFKCGTHTRMEKIFQQDPSLQLQHEELIRNAQKNSSGQRSTYIVPIVFHIIHENGSENISDAQVQDQVDILNRDFRKLNADTANIDPVFQPIAADCNIEFRLATKDPMGNCTNGINHYYSHETRVGDDFSKLNQWNRSRYLNVWVVKEMENGVAGYAYYPSAVDGVLFYADGIIIRHNYIGSIGTGNPSLSRALTHEIGHYLSLPHPWGSTNNPGVAYGDDGVNDTPVTRGWSTCNLTNNAVCTPGVKENVQNYMEYSYCSNMFTQDQATIMQNVLQSQLASRDNLWSATNLSITGTELTSAPLCVPVADFRTNQKFICAEDAVTFTPQSWRATVDNYQWFFPDGNPSSSTAPSPMVTYSTPGWKSATLIVSNATGSDTVSIEHAVHVSFPYATFTGPSIETFDGNTSSSWLMENPGNSPTFWDRVPNGGYNNSGCLKLDNNFSQTFDPFSSERMGGNIDFVISPPFDLSNTSNPTLSFKISAGTRTSDLNKMTEELKVYVSTNCGKTWVLRRTLSGLQLNNAGLVNGEFTPPNNSFWREETVNLGSLANSSNVRFKFEYTASDRSNNVFLDDIQVNGVLSTEDLSANFSVAVFPNPADDLVMIQAEIPFTFELFSMDGRSVAMDHSLSTAKRLETSGLSEGVYLLRFQSDWGITTQRLVIQH